MIRPMVNIFYVLLMGLIVVVSAFQASGRWGRRDPEEMRETVEKYTK